MGLKSSCVTDASDLRPQADQSINFLAGILDRVTLQPSALTRASTRRDQYALYLEEPVTSIPVMDYWRAQESEWPQLVPTAFDFLAVPVMSSECERVFSFCVKQTTPESSRLIGRLL
jgi:hypothetical protein